MSRSRRLVAVRPAPDTRRGDCRAVVPARTAYERARVTIARPPAVPPVETGESRQPPPRPDMASRTVTIDELVAALDGRRVPGAARRARPHRVRARPHPRRQRSCRAAASSSASRRWCAIARRRWSSSTAATSWTPGRRDPRAALAAATLAALGYRDVAALDGGLAAWRRAGLPVVSGAQVSSKAFGRRVGDLERVPSVDVDTLRALAARGPAGGAVRRAQRRPSTPRAASRARCRCPASRSVSHALDMAAESDVIVLCSSARTRSLIVARTLIDLGLADVVALDGGTLAWRLAGLRAGARLAPAPRAAVAAPRASSPNWARRGWPSTSASSASRRPSSPALLYATSGNFSAFDLRNLGHHVVAHVPRSVSVASDVLIVRHERTDRGCATRRWCWSTTTTCARCSPASGCAGWACRSVHKLAGGFAAWTHSGRPASTVAEMPLGWREASAVTPGLGVDDVSRWLAAYAPGARAARGHRRARTGAATCPARAGCRAAGWRRASPRVAPSLDEAAAADLHRRRAGRFAAATLRRRGHVHVAWLQGGTRLWAAAGRVLETSPLPPQDDELLPPARRDAQAMRDYLEWERPAAP